MGVEKVTLIGTLVAVQGIIPSMRCAMFTLGGLPIMMGQQVRSESLFYYFKLDDYIPENHLLPFSSKLAPLC